MCVSDGRLVMGSASEIKLVRFTQESQRAADSISNLLGSQG
jgi:hypothetical protein